MSSYGAVAFQYKCYNPLGSTVTNALDKSMLSSSANLRSTTSQETQNYSTATEVEIGKDPLSDTQHPDSLLTDYSLCDVDLREYSRPPLGIESPVTAEYCIPRDRDIPKDLGPDKEFQIKGSKEPYVMAELNPQEETPYFGQLNQGGPKDSLDLSAIDESPGGRMEHSLNAFPSLYPQLPGFSDASNSSSYLSAEDASPSPPPKQPVQSIKPRMNPFVETSSNLKRTASSVAYNDVVHAAPVPTNIEPPVRPRIPQRPLVATASAPTSSSSSSSSSAAGIFKDPPNNYRVQSYEPRMRGVRSQGQTSDQIDEVMTHLKGTLNNAVQYIASWPGNNFETASSICFLGKLYMGKHQEDRGALDSDSFENRHGSFYEFLSDFQSRVWVTYRRGFPCLQGTNLTSDTGWGCMLRTGQMMLATALQMHCFGRGYRRNTPLNQNRFRELVKQFGDSFDHPFSLHHLLKIGKEHLNKTYGEWYGPSTVAYVLRVCVDYAKEKGINNPILNIRDFTVFTATDCMVFEGDIVKAATMNGTRSWMKMLLLISVRMGADELNLSYRQPIQDFLINPMCIGIMGGRKRHSLYFTGFQGNKLIHYDPHTCQTALKMHQGNAFSTETYVCMKPRKMSFSKMDPSCTFGFYLTSNADLFELTRLAESMGPHKIFELLEGTKEDYLALVNDPSVRAFDHNESMFDEGVDGAEIASLEGSDFEYLE